MSNVRNLYSKPGKILRLQAQRFEEKPKVSRPGMRRLFVLRFFSEKVPPLLFGMCGGIAFD
ncbi:hypothetical protein HED42_16910 [Enterococcus casseliflavus]|uniref:hypothetical protein n=1 Tax=Enterococcus casseliflavus TaxID=37734 RepID=UPI001432AA0B|nr:hypothetical protein [Enterococcus casseliflavus]NKD39815.1 hypothetical protein [Enterococcus casseliflavus]